MKYNHQKEKGFTLVEVLASLLVFSIAILGLAQAGTQGAKSVSVLENKMLGGVIADNVLVRARHDRIRLGVQTGEETQMGRRYAWELETVTTDVAGFLRMTVKVREDDKEQVIMSRTAYRSQPVTKGAIR